MGQAKRFSESGALAGLCKIGRDGHGNWVVRGPYDIYGGLFVSRSEALKFAMFENGDRPQAVVMVPGTLELNTTQ
jgi:hypothetical protein